MPLSQYLRFEICKEIFLSVWWTEWKVWNLWNMKKKFVWSLKDFCKFFISQIDRVESLKLMKFWYEICKNNFGLSRFSGRVDCVESSILYDMNFDDLRKFLNEKRSWISVSLLDCVESLILMKFWFFWKLKCLWI